MYGGLIEQGVIRQADAVGGPISRFVAVALGGLPPTWQLSVTDVSINRRPGDLRRGVKTLGAVIPHVVPSEDRHPAGVAGRVAMYAPAAGGVGVRGSGCDTTATANIEHRARSGRTRKPNNRRGAGAQRSTMLTRSDARV